MNHSNDPIISKNLTAVKQAKSFHNLKSSQQANLTRKTLQKIDNFAKEAAPIVNKAKQAGKIRRNSFASTNQGNKKVRQSDENGKGGCAFEKWANDKLLSKIRCSQIVTHPQKAIISVLKQSSTPNQAQYATIKQTMTSVSSHYQDNYASLIKQYQKKKQKINHQIQSLRKSQTIKLEKTNQINVGNIQTPKFGNYFSQSQKRITIKSPLKTSKEPKIVEFLNAIKCQIDLQGKLRSLKYQIPKDQQHKIIQILKAKFGIDQDLTKIESEQFDPFAQRHKIDTETLVSQLADAHLAADQNWNRNIKNSFEHATLDEIFTSLQSGSQNGTISLMAFVREVGILLQNQKYFRNRDLYRIHNRIKPLRREVFLNLLGKVRNK